MSAAESSAASPWLTAGEAAAYLRIAERTLEGMRRKGNGPVYCRQGARAVFYHRDDLDAWRRRGAASHTTQERRDGTPIAAG